MHQVWKANPSNKKGSQRFSDLTILRILPMQQFWEAEYTQMFASKNHSENQASGWFQHVAFQVTQDSLLLPSQDTEIPWRCMYHRCMCSLPAYGLHILCPLVTWPHLLVRAIGKCSPVT